MPSAAPLDGPIDQLRPEPGECARSEHGRRKATVAPDRQHRRGDEEDRRR